MTTHMTLGLAALALVGSACGGGIRVRTDFDPAYDFAPPKTYTWAPPPQTGDPRIDSSLLQRRIQTATDAVLAEKGYRLATTGQPDFTVGYYGAIEGRVDVSTVNTFYGSAYGWRWGRWYGGRVSEVQTRSYDQGTLIIGVAETATNQIVWQGTAQAELQRTNDPEKRQERIQDAIRQIFKDFPPARK